MQVLPGFSTRLRDVHFEFVLKLFAESSFEALGGRCRYRITCRRVITKCTSLHRAVFKSFMLINLYFII